MTSSACAAADGCATMRRLIPASALLLTLIGAAAAQNATPGTNPAAAPDLALNAAQKQTIYTSARNLNFKNETPPAFQPIVGAIVPAEIRLEPMPDTLVELMPRLRDFGLAVISAQVVVVDPQSRRVAEVISGEH